MALSWRTDGFSVGIDNYTFPIVCGILIADDTTGKYISGMKFYGDNNTVEHKVGVSPDGIIYFNEAGAGSCNIHVVDTYGIKYIISAGDILENISAPAWVELHEET